MSYAAAAALLQDGQVIATVGLASNLMLPRFYAALATRFARTGSPRQLTSLTHGGNGSRGKLPGTIDDLLRIPGLFSRFFVAHIDTHVHAKRRMVQQPASLEVHILPLGVMSFIYEAMARKPRPEVQRSPRRSPRNRPASIPEARATRPA